jgi:uncharacterized membrane protein
MMGSFLLAWFSVALVLLPLDALWLTSMKGFYQRELGELLLPSPRLGVAAAFYMLFAATLAYFAVLPNRDAEWTAAAFAGAFLGFAVYGAYDLTNYATLRGFTLRVMAADWVWGTALGAVSAGAGWRLLRAFGG